jgi:hypothetical protein
MVKYAPSRVKSSHDKLSSCEKKLSQAAEVYDAEQAKPEGTQRGLRKIAELYGVDHNTLHRKVNKTGKTRKEYLLGHQKLTEIQETRLVALLIEMDQRGLGFDHIDIRLYALAILNSRKKKGSANLGQNWVSRFLDRHHKELSMRWSTPLDIKRTRSLTPQNIERHFQCIEETTDQYGIIPDNDYNMDETPIMLGCTPRRRVAGKAGRKQSYQHRDGNRETVTAVECICADGTALKPTIIFRGKTFDRNWGGTNNPCEAQ